VTTYVAGRSWIDGWGEDALDVIGGVESGGTATLTRPRVRVISSTKWEVNIIKKYKVESSAMVFRIFGSLPLVSFVVIAKKIINENASKSGAYDGSVEINIACSKGRVILTHHRRGRGLCTRFLGLCVGRVNTHDMRQRVGLGTLGLETCNRSEAHERSG